MKTHLRSLFADVLREVAPIVLALVVAAITLLAGQLIIRHVHGHGDLPRAENAAVEVHCGYGECSISGCPCRAYMGSGWNCDNCGHRYEWHY